ncbi:biotin--protein ligase 2-like isoform X2 [Cynara cardunculus var. scolymus]|uniref:biotin--protein ligase 2-like isoform X2 n=1 Tax=Cynara cardunculus var. scolymus TaxID=59895 RepID=UPI000D626664|nr:biotin--protein ligase 2-like isoform X2 [Cynara cardunculus var. scolymus]
MLINSLRTSFHCFLDLQRTFSFTRPFQKKIFNLSLSVATASAKMESQPPCLLVLNGKSASEQELAKSLKENSCLRLADDVKLLTFLQPEMERQLEEDEFNIDTYMGSLMTTCFGRILLWSPRLPSTQDVVSLNYCEIPVGSVCIADVQFKGRGRSQNVWESPKGGLLFSFTIQMEDGRVVPLVQYIVCLAMTEAIKDLALLNGIPPLDVRIKWPNDLYLDGLKVGGILCTSTYRSKKFNVSAGVGLNVDNDKPTTSLNAALRKLTSGYRLRREDIASAFFNKFEYLFHILINQGFQPLEELYYKAWLHSGQRIVVQEKNEDQDLLIENVVTVQGLTPSGYLLAIADSGEMCELHPDGNSFDFFKGLVRRKLP